MWPKICIGYHGLNHTLRAQHILTDRTARQDTILGLERKCTNTGLKYLRDLFHKNVEDLYKIIQWNVKKGIHFYRISSGLAPHITNPVFIPRRDQRNYRTLAYSLNGARSLLQKIGKLARDNNMRLTFHPGQFVSLSSTNPELITRSTRDLYYHTLILDMMGMDDNSVLVIHGGGLYGDKRQASQNWIRNYRKLPTRIRRRVVLENDEKNYSIADILAISKQTGVPIVFDIFHYYLYNRTIIRKRGLGETDLLDQPLPEDLFPTIIRTWRSSRSQKRVKMHISEQKRGGVFGAHSKYVRSIPTILLNFPKKYGCDLDLMIEAKANEKAVFYLWKKYKGKLC
jgi:UV DNA damage endonuclease